MTSRQLEQTFNESDCSCTFRLYHNYGSSKTWEKSLLSHPGQYEQLYLAKKLEERYGSVQNKMILNNLQK
jgi:hypothetical protein